MASDIFNYLVRQWWFWVLLVAHLILAVMSFLGMPLWMNLLPEIVGGVVLAFGLVVIGAWMGQSNILGGEAKPRTMIQVAILVAPVPMFLVIWMWFGVDVLWAIGISLGIPVAIFSGIGAWVLYDHKYVPKEPKKRPRSTAPKRQALPLPAQED